MKKVTQITTRKADHIRVNLDEDVMSGLTNGLENYTFIHEALPEVNYSDIETSLNIFNKHLNAPILISSMTGGTEEARNININLAIAAEDRKVAMGIGSQRAALEDSNFTPTFYIRRISHQTLSLYNSYLCAYLSLTHVH